MTVVENSVPIITIDGPSGAGKGTVCSIVAQALGYSLLDSGSLYRLTALSAFKQGIDLSSELAVALVARDLDVQFEVSGEKDIAVSVILSGEDVSLAIREESTGMNASIVAAYPLVRDALLDMQRGFARLPGLVADGRDMGTVVFPRAKVKIFLTASAEERARRRFLQLKNKGDEPILEMILMDIIARDEKESSRAISPLKPAEDALVLDSTELSVEQVVDIVLKQVRQG
jgi:cytidylate kinase